MLGRTKGAVMRLRTFDIHSSSVVKAECVIFIKGSMVGGRDFVCEH